MVKRLSAFVVVLGSLLALLGAGGGVPVDALKPGTNGQCVTTDGGVAAWGSCGSSSSSSGGASAGANKTIQTSDGAGGFQAATNVLAESGIVTIGPNAADDGTLRVGNGSYIKARNQAGSDNLSLLGSDSSNQTQLGNASNATYLNGSTVVAPSTLSVGTSPYAGTGTFRLPKDGTIYYRNEANSADLLGLSKDTSNRVVIGDTGNASYLRVTPGGGDTFLSASGEMQYLAGSSQLHTFKVSGNEIVQINSTNVLVGKPQIGDATAHGAVDGAGAVAITGHTTLSDSVYRYRYIVINSGGGEGGAADITLPNPATDAAGYGKWFMNTSAATLTLKAGSAAATCTLASGRAAHILVLNNATYDLTAAQTFP